MCGIVGIVESSGRPVNHSWLEAMNGSIRHRGPDDDGFYVNGPVGLGMRRLSIIDVGGGQGALLASILQTYPQARGTLFDLPAVVESARALLDAAGITDRCTCVAGDFFRTLPGGGDAYLFKRVIHDWDDPQAQATLTHYRRAMASHGRLLVMERVLPVGNTSSLGPLDDITMLVHYGALERTEAEYHVLLQAAGFTLARIMPTQAPLSIIEGILA